MSTAGGALMICRRLLLSLTVLEMFLSQVVTVQAQSQGYGRSGAANRCRLFSEPDEDKREFYSPLYPEHYPNNTECILKLQADYGYVIRIDFRDYFHLEPSDSCEFDFLEIRDGAHGYSDVKGKVCGNDFPKIITSKDRNLWLRFNSDDTIEYKGFRAVYEFIENTAIDRPEISQCIFLVNGIQGLITESNISSELRDYSKKYNYPIDCTWKIEVGKNEKLYLFFGEFLLEEPNECEVNYVDLFGKDTDERNLIKHYCGSVADPIVTKTNMLYFRYFSMPNAIDSTFTAWFTAFRERDTDKKRVEEDLCTEEEYDCDDATCIDGSLKCNGIKNCRHEYDEEGCNSLTKLKFDIRSEHIIIILTLGCGLLGGMCFAMCFNCIRKLVRDGRQIHENIRRSREQLEERSHTMSSPSSPRVVYRPTINEDGPCYISDAKTNGHPCIRPESETESEGDEDDDEEEVDDLEESCVEMRDCECQTRDSLLTQRDSGHTQLPMTPPPPPPPNRRPPGLPPLSPGHPPAVPTPPPPPGYYGRAPSGPPSDHYGSYGRPPVPRHNDPYEVDDQSDDSYAQRYRAEAVIEMRDKGPYEPSKSPKTTPDVLATH